MPAVPDVAGVPSAEELAALPHDELAARLAEAYRAIAGLTARVELLERRAGRDSSTSSKPPSSDSPYQKKPRDRSLREWGKQHHRLSLAVIPHTQGHVADIDAVQLEAIEHEPRLPMRSSANPDARRGGAAPCPRRHDPGRSARPPARGSTSPSTAAARSDLGRRARPGLAPARPAAVPLVRPRRARRRGRHQDHGDYNRGPPGNGRRGPWH